MIPESSVSPCQWWHGSVIPTWCYLVLLLFLRLPSFIFLVNLSSYVIFHRLYLHAWISPLLGWCVPLCWFISLSTSCQVCDVRPGAPKVMKWWSQRQRNLPAREKILGCSMWMEITTSIRASPESIPHPNLDYLQTETSETYASLMLSKRLFGQLDLNLWSLLRVKWSFPHWLEVEKISFRKGKPT
jgi:hypothetical protein